jgi:hypothetical protein
MSNSRSHSLPVVAEEQKQYILKPHQREFLQRWVMDGMNQTEAALASGVTRQAMQAWWRKAPFRKAAGQYIRKMEDVDMMKQFRNRLKRKDVVNTLMDHEDPDVQLTAVRRSQQEEPDQQEHVVTTNPFSIQGAPSGEDSWTESLPTAPALEVVEQ